MGKSWKIPRSAGTTAVVSVALLALGLAACGGSSGGSTTTSVTKTVTRAAPASTAPASTAPASTSTAAGSGGASAAGSTASSSELPTYQPSTVVSKTAGSTVLTSPDSVSKIGAFYKDALGKGGWELRSSSSSAYHASFTAHRDSEGVTISVDPRGSGSGISITRHPE